MGDEHKPKETRGTRGEEDVEDEGDVAVDDEDEDFPSDWGWQETTNKEASPIFPEHNEDEGGGMTVPGPVLEFVIEASDWKGSFNNANGHPGEVATE